MFDPREANELTVFKGDRLAGRLARTADGAVFEYEPAYRQANSRDGSPVALATSLPLADAQAIVRGVNLHPYFAGLLPEGLRLQAIVRSLKTSNDDLFSLLAALGPDVIGDVWCHRADGALATVEPPATPLARTHELGQADFDELFQRALDGADASAFAGVQPKVSAARLNVSVRDTKGSEQFILKLPSPDYPSLVPNESFFMTLAAAVGIESASVRIVKDRLGIEALLVQRFDRTPQPTRDAQAPSYRRLHVEDVGQLLGLYPADKYRVSLADAARAMLHATAPVVETLRLLELHAFSYIVCNGDLHAKNASLLTSDGRVRLSPAYDIVSTLAYGDDSMAMKLDSKDKRLKARDFVHFGERFGVRSAATLAMLKRLVERTRKALAKGPGLDSIGFEKRPERHLQRTIEQRLTNLS